MHSSITTEYTALLRLQICFSISFIHRFSQIAVGVLVFSVANLSEHRVVQFHRIDIDIANEKKKKLVDSK